MPFVLQLSQCEGFRVFPKDTTTDEQTTGIELTTLQPALPTESQWYEKDLEFRNVHILMFAVFSKLFN